MSAEQPTYSDKAPEFLRGIINIETRELSDPDFQIISQLVGDSIRTLNTDILRYVVETWRRLQTRLTDVQSARLQGIAAVANEGIHITPEITEEETTLLRPWGEIARQQDEHIRLGKPADEYPLSPVFHGRNSVPRELLRLRSKSLLSIRQFGKDGEDFEPTITPRGKGALALFDLRQSGQLATDLGIKSIPQS